MMAGMQIALKQTCNITSQIDLGGTCHILNENFCQKNDQYL